MLKINKLKLVTIILVITVMLIGTGYAYWQEELTINTTVDTGSLDVQFTPVMEMESSDYDIGDSWYEFDKRHHDGSAYMNVTVTPDDDNHTLNCTFSNIYPGSGGYISFKIINTGTLPAQVSGVTATNVNETIEGLKDEFNYNINSLIIYKKNSYPTIIPSRPVGSFSEFVEVLSDMMDDFILEPGEYIELSTGDKYMEQGGYNIELPYGDTENNELQDQEFSFQLKLHFEQVK